MSLPILSPLQWALALLAAVLVGTSKTCIPGAGMLAVPLMAGLFAGRSSPGALLPMLLPGDLFAILWFRRHAVWKYVLVLIPWVAVGLVAGAALLWGMGSKPGLDNWVGKIIAVIVLAMLALHLLRKKLGDRLQPHSPVGRALVGAIAGFSTTVSNAAGPVMNMYLASADMPKEQFIGTAAWYFGIINLSKVPVFIVLTMLAPASPMINGHTLLFNLVVAPAVVLGAFMGRWLLFKIPEALFETVVLVLSGLASVQLLLK